MIVWYGIPFTIGMVLIMRTKRFFGERVSMLFGARFSFRSLAWKVTTLSASLPARSSFLGVLTSMEPILPMESEAISLPLSGEEMKITLPISGRCLKINASV